MELSVCSYSYHRMLKAGAQDIFGYIETCREIGCTHLDPWNGHVDLPREAGVPPAQADKLSEEESSYLKRVREAIDRTGLPVACLAVDGAHIYEEDAAAREARRANAYRWLRIAERLGARRVRIDSGGAEELTDSMLDVIAEGYADVIGRARDLGIGVIIENHWGPSKFPKQLRRILDASPGLGLLLDSWNWAPGQQAQGWLEFAGEASATHIKTFHFTDDGQELTQNIPAFIALLRKAGYSGPWGIESVPADGDEPGAVQRTIELIRGSL